MLTSLYKVAAFDAARQDGQQLTQATATAAAQQQQETEAARREGFVATATQRAGTEQTSEDDPFLAVFDEAAKRRGYYADDE